MKKEYTLDDVMNTVGQTGLLAASARMEGGIAHAQEIYDELKRLGVEFGSGMPLMEARYKNTNRVLAGETNITQVLELGSGMSPRGLNMCLENPDMTYVELDTPALIGLKTQILEKITNGNVPPKLHLVGGNVSNSIDFNTATKEFSPDQSVAVISEGLVSYLSIPQKSELFQYIHELLKKHNGFWLCSHSSEKLDPQRIERVCNDIGIDLRENAFASHGIRDQFIDAHGFSKETFGYDGVLDELNTFPQHEQQKLSKVALDEKLGDARIAKFKATGSSLQEQLGDT